MSSNVEQIAIFDLYLKSIPKFGLINIINIDNLIPLNASNEEILKLKQAANNLNNVKAYIRLEDLDNWNNALKDQVRFSINYVKNLKEKNIIK